MGTEALRSEWGEDAADAVIESVYEAIVMIESGRTKSEVVRHLCELLMLVGGEVPQHRKPWWQLLGGH